MAKPADKPLLIFDFDGTLANTMETGVAIYNEIGPDYGLKTVTMEEVQELRKLNTRAIMDRLGLSRFTAIKLGAHLKKLLHQRMDEVAMIDGVTEALQSLHEAEFRMGILSSNSVDNITTFLNRYGLLANFEFIEAGVSLFGKPQRIKSILKKVKTHPADAIYVGDETRDMEGAREAKVAGLAVCWGANGREAMLSEGPEFCIDDPSELVGCAREFVMGQA